jgi:2-hydroxychromene-2-carboxylate isomerase
VELGGFGVPSMVVGDDLFFGNDRMPLVEAALIRAADIRLVLPGQHGA